MSEYMRRLNLAIANGLIDRGMAGYVEVMHDAYCGMYANKECNCDPIITVTISNGKHAIVMHDGTLKTTKQ